MKKFTFSLLTIVFLSLSCNKNDTKVVTEVNQQFKSALVESRCASNEVLEAQIAANPERGRKLEELERKTKYYKGRDQGIFRNAGILYLPVVVHVVHTTEGIVTDEQIASQIDVLNKDFNKQNAELSNTSVYLAGYDYNKVANCQIQFYLSQTVRVQTSVTAFGTNDAVKKSSQGGSDPVDPTTKLNMWVCNLDGGLLGYAQFPGGNASTDGVVIDYQAFGTTANYLFPSFNLGRTATHEIGHWINLRHIWGDRRCGTDYVTDTPAHDGSNFGCPPVGLKSLCKNKPLEQWMNYMDYTDDRCMYMFSDGQKLRMDAAIDNARKAYFSTSKFL